MQYAINTSIHIIKGFKDMKVKIIIHHDDADVEELVGDEEHTFNCVKSLKIRNQTIAMLFENGNIELDFDEIEIEGE